MRVVAIGLLAALVACAPDEEEIDLPIDVCGQDEPVQILALEDEQVIGASGSARFEERWLFGVRTFEIPLTRVDTALGGIEGRPYRQTAAEIVAVDECGEDRGVVATGVDTIYPATTEDEPWLACASDTGVLYWFDPAGMFEPRFIGRSEWCGRHLVRGNIVFVLLGDGTLVRARLDREDFTTEALVTDVVEAPALLDHRITGTELPDDVFVLQSDRTIVRVALRTGVVQVELEGADSFSVSDDRRWLTWGIHDEQGSPVTAWLRNRESGEDLLLGAPTWATAVAYSLGPFVIVSGSTKDGGEKETQILEASTLRSVWLEGVYIIWGIVDRTLAVSDLSDPTSLETQLLDFESGELLKVSNSRGDAAVEGGAVWLRDFSPYAGHDLPSAFAPFDVVRVDVETLDREVARPRVFSNFEMAADRWIVATPLDDDGVVELHYLDGASLRHRAFAHDVVAFDTQFDIHREASQGAPPITDEHVYQVHTRASDDTGVWRVRFAD